MTYKDDYDSDSASDSDSDGTLGQQFIPFGSVVSASGCSVRVTVSCSAGLAAQLPLWGISLRGDQAWLIRALRPTRVVVLREGEHSLLQAQLVDADGRGVPSAERLLRATLLATPALPVDRSRAVKVQRDGAQDATQRGSDPPRTLQKRELNRFMEGCV